MNIFVVDADPNKAARDLCDKHCVKMIVESAQLLCTAYDTAPYKKTHINHPCAVWCRLSEGNYFWLLAHAYEMCKEYTRRYSKTHASQAVIDFCWNNMSSLKFIEKEATDFVQCVPDVYKAKNAIEAYRNYYIGDKAKFAKWNYSETPQWWPKAIQ